MISKLNPDLIPKSLSLLAVRVGLPEVLLLVELFGGRKEYIPKTVRADHPIALGCGHEVLNALVRLYGGTWYFIPRMNAALKEARNCEIVAEYNRGTSANDLAGKWQLTERQIWNILKQPLPAFKEPKKILHSPGQLSF